MRHLGIPDAERLDVDDSSYWYYDAHSQSLHEWQCSCRPCLGKDHDVPSTLCRWQHTAYTRFDGIGATDLTIDGVPFH